MTKNQAVNDLQSGGTPATMELVKILLSAIIDEIRMKNDDAEQPEFLVNQGKIQVCKELIMYLEVKK